MKVGIVTFHGANNYGAVLQAYALSHWLTQNGIESEIIDYKSKVFEKYELFRKEQYKSRPYLPLVDLIKYPKKNRRNGTFNDFRDKHLHISADSYTDVSQLIDIEDKFDYFICGSDQIWNPELTKGFDPVYFLDFVSDSRKKIAYAPSIALKRLNDFQKAEILQYLSSFGSISIREQEGIDLVQPYCEQNIAKCCDPVFLLNNTYYDEICSVKYEDERFIFLYVVGRASNFKKVIKYAQEKAKAKGCKLYYIIDGDKTLVHINGKDVFGCSPADFLSLIKNAKYVIGNSFHATAFSIIYSKRFVTFLKPGTGSRMVNLLRSLSLQDRIFGESSEIDILDREIDYDAVTKSLGVLVKTSTDFLQFALGTVDAVNGVHTLGDDETIQRRQKREELLNFIEWRRQALLMRHVDKDIVARSRSGGVFTAFSDAILARGGAIYGCKMETPHVAIHARATTKEERDLFRGSKYIQSEMRDCYKQVKNDLNNGLSVLFSGTGCQVAGLYKYLGNTDTSRLYTVDIICHGTSSPKLWSAYIKWMENRHGKRITDVNFRDKRYGWKAHLETVKMGEELHTTSIYRMLYLHKSFMRPSCYECPYASLHRTGDITIGDAWGVEKTKSSLNDDKGCSIVLINSANGEELLDYCKSSIIHENVDLEQFFQPNLYEPSFRPNDRDICWECFETEGFDVLAKRYGKPGPRRRIKDKVIELRA